MRAEPLVPTQHTFLSDSLTQNAKIIVWRLQTRGVKDVNDYMKRMSRKNQVRALLFDQSGRVVAGDTLVEGAKELALAASKRDEVEFHISGADLMAARRAVASDGKVYVLFASMPRTVLSMLRVPPTTRVLRISAVILIGSLVCFALARSFADPVTKLRDATHRFAAGDLSVRVSPQLGRRRDELADLARDFDAMAAQIATLLTAQRRLIGDVSHELRTPLTRLNLALELARRHAGDGAAPALSRIEREAAQLNELIGQLLMLSRLESGDERPEKTLVDLSAMLRDVVTDSQLEADATNRKIQLQNTEPCSIHGTPTVLRSALENVIRNALRYTPENSTVEISLCRNDNQAILTVRDHGPGVPADALDQIFRPFYRVDDARDREDGGAGLGLAIVERAIHSHGGQVRASNAQDGGLIIKMHLPLA